MEVSQSNLRALILVWAFAESGIGGILHALKLPLTGLLVGGIAIVCIALTAYWSGDRRNSVLEALLTVILVKLAVSPHSPWQAYIAVFFQGYLGYLLFRGRKQFAFRSLIFAILCMAESALQKLLMTWLIYGTDFLQALDQAAFSVIKSFGWAVSGSVVIWAFGLYFLTYLLAGAILGKWIPSVPLQVEAFHQILPPMTVVNDNQPVKIRNRHKPVILGFLLFACLLVLLKLLAPQLPATDLIFIFCRSVAISMLLIFLAGPFFMFLIRKWAGHRKESSAFFTDTIEMIPVFTSSVSKAFQWVYAQGKGFGQWKTYILALLVVSLRLQKK